MLASNRTCGLIVIMAAAKHKPRDWSLDLEASEAVNWHPAFVVLTFKSGRLLWPELVIKHDDSAVEFRGEVIPV